MQEFIASRRDLERAAGRRAQGLRGVRPPLPARVERPGQPLAAVDPAERDDLRRPRHPRRLEHLAGPGARRWRPPSWWHERIVAGLGVVLGLPAPRQPRRPRSGPRTSCGARSPTHDRATTSSTSPPRSTVSPTAPTRQPDDLPLELLARLRRPGPPRRRRLAGGPGARAGPTARCSTTTRWPGSTSRCAATSTTCSIGTSLPFLLAPGLHHVEAFGEALATGAWGKRVGRVGEKVRQTVDLEHWAAFQDGFRRGRPDGRRGRQRASAAGRRARSRSCPATSTTPTSPRPGPTPPSG